MSKFCKKDNCIQPPIPRGKYCEQHRSCKKLRSPPPSYQNEVISQQLNNEEERLRLEEDRLLRQEQEREYNETVIKDRERIRLENEKKESERFEEELAQIMKMSAEMEIENSIKKKRFLLERHVVDENDKSNYQIKFKLKDFTILKKFNKNSTINDLRFFVDMYIHENKIPIENYDLVKNFPKEILSDLDLELCKSNLSRNCILYVENLD